MRQFDAQAPFDPQAVQRSLHLATLAPNSSNLQLWEFRRVHTPELLQQVARACFNQSAARTARELIVVVVRRDKWWRGRNFNLQMIRQRLAANPDSRGRGVVAYYKSLIPFVYTHDAFGVLGRVKQLVALVSGLFAPIYRQTTRADARIVAHKSAALAAMTFMYAMQAEGYDTCPMEGFDSWRLKRALGIPWAAEINMVIGTGPGLPQGIYNDRWRLPESDTLIDQ